LKQVPEDVVRDEIEIAYQGNVPQSLRRALKDPSALLAKLASLIEEFWHRAVAPEWGLLHARLEGEVLFRARSLAMGGLDHLFRGMHRDISYYHGRLTVRTDSEASATNRPADISLLLILCERFVRKTRTAKNVTIWITMAFYGLFYALTNPVLKALVVETVTPDVRGRALGIYFFLTSVTTLLASVITGELWKVYGAGAPFYVSSVIGALSGVLLLVRRERAHT